MCLAVLAALTVLPALPAAAEPSPSLATDWTRMAGSPPKTVITGKPGDGTSTVVAPVDRRGRSLSSGALRSKVAPGAPAAGSFARGTLSTVALSDIHVTYDAGFQANAPAMAAFERAVTTWEHAVASPVTIEVTASLDSLQEGQLGGAGPTGFYENGGLLYPSALADALEGTDLDAQQVPPLAPLDIEAVFANRAGTFYFGADPAGIAAAPCVPFDDPTPTAGTCYDFESVVLHELGHGLGFTGSVSQLNDGRVFYGYSPEDPIPFVYDIFTQTAAGASILDLPNLSPALKTAATGGALYWNGSEAAGADRGRKPRLFAPNPFEQGSSFSHLDDEAYPRGDVDALMTPYAEAADITRDPGEITLGMFRDMGWVTPGLPGNRYTALTTPARVLDTRTGLGNNGIADIRIAGAFGVPAGATAAVLNVTLGAPPATSTVRVYPRPRAVGAPRPAVGNVIARAGETRDGMATVGIDRRTGRVQVHNTGGATRVVVYLVGYYAPDATAVDTDFHPNNPVRIMDTRAGIGVRRGVVPQGGVIELQVTGRNGIPAGATSVALTLTAVGPTTNAYAYTYPTGASPSVVNLHLRRAETASNQVIVRIGTGGKIRFRNGPGSTHLVADLAGWFHPTTTTGYLHRLSLPQRLVGTRLAAGGARDVLVSHASVTEYTGVPTTAAAAILSLTGASATAATALQLYPGTAIPRTQNVSLAIRQTAINQAMVGLSSGRVRVRNTAGTATAYVDLFGWFGPA